MIRTRHSLLIWFTGVLGVLLLVRLFFLTVIAHDDWKAYAEDASMRVVYETAARGDIFDRNGAVLATSRAVYSVNLSRVNLTQEKAISDAAEVMKILREYGENVSTTQQEVLKTLSDNSYNAYLPIELASGIGAETAQEILAQQLPGIQISTNYIREYPQGALASHVIGYLGRISEEELEAYGNKSAYQQDAMVGKSGMEKVYESKLKGKDAISNLQVDSTGKVTKVLNQSTSVKGKDLKLTLDIRLQKVTEDALEQAITQAAAGGTFQSEYGACQMISASHAAVGAAVAVDVKSGEVLAMASFPDFDPNEFATGISEEKWEALQQANPYDPMSASPLYHVAAMSAVQPGSTFKPVTALAALSCGLNPQRALYDDGRILLGGRSYGCYLWNDSKKTHGYVDLNGAMKDSCNYYFYDIASGKDFASGVSLGYEKEITNDTILSWAKKLGLGSKTGIELSESSGTLPSESLKQQGLQRSLEEKLLAEQEYWFQKSALKNRNEFYKNLKKFLNWSEKDLTLEEIIGKLKAIGIVKEYKVEELAAVCKYDYFDQMAWSQGDTFNLSIGQGDHAYTTLQMAGYMAALGNGCQQNGLTLVKQSGTKTSNASSSAKKQVSTIIEAMTAVTGDGGSLQPLFAGFPFSVAAKTGTAQRTGHIQTESERSYFWRYLHKIAPDITFSEVVEEAERLMKTYPDLYQEEDAAIRRAVLQLSSADLTSEDLDQFKERYDGFAWTVALAPAEDPQIAVAVMLVQGKSSFNAAPVVREMIGKYGEMCEWEKLF